MSFALYALPGIFSPLNDWWHRPSPVPLSRHMSAPRQDPFRAAGTPLIRKPLRVVRVLEVGQAPGHVGRMTISGRMADVCAELDRLASLH